MATDIAINVLAREVGFDKVAKNIGALEANVRRADKSLKFLHDEQKRGSLTQKEYTSSVLSVNRALHQQNLATIAQGNAMEAGSKKMSKMNMALQQGGYQLQDFVVQVQGGTSALVALSQQGSQMLGIFGPAGAIAGAFLSIGTVAAGMFLALKDGAKEAAEEAEKLAEMYERVDEVLEGMVGNLDQMQLGQTSEVHAAQKALDESRRALGEVRAEVQRLEEDFAKAQGKIDLFWQSGSYSDLQSRLREAKELLEQRVQEEAKAAENLEKAKGLQEEINKFKEEELRIIEELKLSQEVIADGSEAILTVWENIVGAVKDSAVEMAGVAQQIREATLAAGARDLIVTGQVGGEDYIQQMADLFEDTQDRINGEGKYKPKKSGGGSKREKETPESRLRDLMDELKLETELLLMSESRQEAIRRLGEFHGKVSDDVITGIAEQIENYHRLEEAIQVQEDLIDSIDASFVDMFTNIVDGTMTVEDAFKSMIHDIISSIYEMLVLQPLVESFMSLFGGGNSIGGTIIGTLTGGLTKGFGSQVSPASPSVTPAMAPSAVKVPQVNPVVPTVNQVFNINGNGDQFLKNAMRTEIAKAQPSLTKAAVNGVVNARRAGGTMKAAFGN